MPVSVRISKNACRAGAAIASVAYSSPNSSETSRPTIRETISEVEVSSTRSVEM